ncbi:MAG: tyrosine-type recombinase/integrase [bacterium]
MTVHEARTLLEAAHGDRLEAAWATMLLLGLRPGELCGLAWEDVEFKAGLLHVRHARLQEPGGARVADYGKCRLTITENVGGPSAQGD